MPISSYSFRNMSFLKWPLLTLVGLLLVGEFLRGDVTTLVQYVRANLDATTKGVIVRTEELRTGKYGGRTYIVWYGYEVGGESYMSRIVNYLGDIDNIKEYPEGKGVTVHYDSTNPNFSVLQVTRLGVGVVFYWLFAFGLSIIVFMFSFPSRPKKARSNPKRVRKW